MKHITFQSTPDKGGKISQPKSIKMQASIHIRHDHRASDKWHRLLTGILPSASLAPHQPETRKEESRKPHRWLRYPHRQIAG